ncbi:MAG: hypothetical protein QXU81_10745, partial [Candidatus Bathyarchaeia archaeon]
GTITGPIIGSIIRIGLGEFLRVIFGWRAGIDLLVFGLVLMLIVLFFRKGIWGFIRVAYRLGGNERWPYLKLRA